jgi:hypothetical protein
MESRLKTPRSILTAVAFVALAATANSAEHGNAAAHSDNAAAHREGPGPGDAAANTAGPTGSAGRIGAGPRIDLTRPDDGYANLRRRAVRSSLIANGPKKNPVVVLATPPVVRPTSPGPPAEPARNAIGVSPPASVGLHGLSVIHPTTDAGTRGNAVKTTIGSHVGEFRHDNPQFHPITPTLNTGLNGTAMGRPTTSPATLGGPAHVVSGIGGTSMRPKY